MRPPVILCAFSNSNDAYLSQLEKEKEAISDALRERQGKGHLLLDTDPRTIKKLRDRLLLYQPQVEIIHYAGHASGSQLLMEDATVYGAGLLQSIALQKNLQLVFLNGCSTQEQVDQLLDAGVRAVIATSVDIGDDTATRFAEDFYQKLASGHSIDEAFKLATEVVTAKNNATLSTTESQDRGIARLIKAPNTGPVWGLYLHKNHQDAASHRLSEKSFYELHIKSQIDSKFNTSEDAILASLYNVLMTFSDELPMFEDLEKKYGEQWDPKKFDVREVKNAIINSLPSPIAEQVRKLLVTEDEPLASERLRFLINTYSVMADLLLFIMFSQLWEALVQGKVPVLEDNLKEQINAFFLLDHHNRQAYDVIPLVRLIHDKLKAHDVPLFVNEMSHLADLMDERDSEFFGAYLNITRVKSKYRDLAVMEDIDDRECQEDCQKTEASLCIMFKELGFCARYKFATIKNIYINKKKNQPAVYQHKMVKLDYVLVGFTDKMEDFENFTDSNSVVIYKIEDKKLSAFNLYPFVIDMNALISEKLSKIYFFYNYDKSATTAATCTYNFIKNINEKKDRLQIPALPNFLKTKTDLKISQEELETIGPEILDSVEVFISYFKS